MPYVTIRPDSQRASYAPGEIVTFTFPSEGVLLGPSLHMDGNYVNSGTDMKLPTDIGIQGAIQQVDVENANGGLETIRYYDRLIKALTAGRRAADDHFASSEGALELRGGTDAIAAILAETTRAFSMRIHAGIFSQNVDLAQLNGLKLSIRLNDQRNFLESDTATDSYSLTDLAIRCKISDDGSVPVPKVLQFTSYQTVAQTLRNGREILMTNISAPVKAFFATFLSSSFNYSLANPYYQLSDPGLTNAQFKVGGREAPYTYKLETAAERVDGFLLAVNSVDKPEPSHQQVVTVSSNKPAIAACCGAAFSTPIDAQRQPFTVEVESGANVGSTYIMFQHFRTMISI